MDLREEKIRKFEMKRNEMRGVKNHTLIPPIYRRNKWIMDLKKPIWAQKLEGSGSSWKIQENSSKKSKEKLEFFQDFGRIQKDIRRVWNLGLEMRPNSKKNLEKIKPS